MSFISKVELKYQLEKMGVKVEGDYVKRKDIKKIFLDDRWIKVRGKLWVKISFPDGSAKIFNCIAASGTGMRLQKDDSLKYNRDDILAIEIKLGKLIKAKAKISKVDVNSFDIKYIQPKVEDVEEILERIK